MPYRWTTPDPDTRRLTLWPHRSLTAEGFVWFIGGTACLIALPLIAVLGSPVMWGLLPFAGVALAGLWWALRRNSREGALTEELTLRRTRVDLVRRDPDGRVRDWSADLYWVTLSLRPTGGPVEDYLTLRGGGREVELGAFLSSAERRALRAEIDAALIAVRAHAPISSAPPDKA